MKYIAKGILIGLFVIVPGLMFAGLVGVLWPSSVPYSGILIGAVAGCVAVKLARRG